MPGATATNGNGIESKGIPMSDNSVDATPNQTAKATLPAYPGANACAVARVWEHSYEADARRWVTEEDGTELVSLTIGSFCLTVTPEQWVSIERLVRSVFPERVAVWTPEDYAQTVLDAAREHAVDATAVLSEHRP